MSTCVNFCREVPPPLDLNVFILLLDYSFHLNPHVPNKTMKAQITLRTALSVSVITISLWWLQSWLASSRNRHFWWVTSVFLFYSHILCLVVNIGLVVLTIMAYRRLIKTSTQAFSVNQKGNLQMEFWESGPSMGCPFAVHVKFWWSPKGRLVHGRSKMCQYCLGPIVDAMLDISRKCLGRECLTWYTTEERVWMC